MSTHASGNGYTVQAVDTEVVRELTSILTTVWELLQVSFPNSNCRSWKDQWTPTTSSFILLAQGPGDLWPPEILKGSYTWLQLLPATICQQICWPRDLTGNNPICAWRSWKGCVLSPSFLPAAAHEQPGWYMTHKRHSFLQLQTFWKGLILSFSSSKPQSISNSAGTETWKETHLCSQRSWSGCILNSSPSSHVKSSSAHPGTWWGTHPGTWWGTHPYILRKPGMWTSVLSLDLEIALGLGFSPSQPLSRANPAHLGTYSVTWKKPFKGPSRSHTSPHI